MKKTKKRKYLSTVLYSLMILFGIGGIILSFSYGTWSKISITTKIYPINRVNGIALNSNGDIYIGSLENSIIQVFDIHGEYLYGIELPINKSNFNFGFADEKLHIVASREKKHYVFDEKKLIVEETIEQEQQKDILNKLYNNLFDNNKYKLTSFHSVVVRDKITNQLIQKIPLNLPIWPFSIFVYFIIAAIGIVLLMIQNNFIDKMRQDYPDNPNSLTNLLNKGNKLK